MAYDLSAGPQPTEFQSGRVSLPLGGAPLVMAEESVLFGARSAEENSLKDVAKTFPFCRLLFSDVQ